MRKEFEKKSLIKSWGMTGEEKVWRRESCGKDRRRGMKVGKGSWVEEEIRENRREKMEKGERQREEVERKSNTVHG